MFERKREPLASTSVFAKRLAGAAIMAGTLIAAALCIGILGYHWIAGFDLVDSFLEASMILGGMGPVAAERLPTAGKVFAAIYALFSGLVFIAVLGIVLAPLTHRLLHQFHVDEDDLK